MLRGKLNAKNLGDRVKLYFIQRGNQDENRNVPIKIYKKESPDLPFCNDLAGMPYDRWFESADSQNYTDEGVKLIFEGVLPLNNSFNEYIDEEVEVGHKYIYWVTADSFGENTVLGPCAVKVRSRDIWWPYEKWTSEMSALERRYGSKVRMKYYGYTAMKKAIPGIVIGNQDRVIALVGAIHASEPGPELLLKVADYMLKNKMELLDKFGLAILPALNIDVREETCDGVFYYQRLNHNGVDINRNFDHNWREDFVYGMSNEYFGAQTYHGLRPCSEGETEAAMAFLEDVKPEAVFVYDNVSVITEDKIYYYGVDIDTPCYSRCTELCRLYSKEFRMDRPGCGTFTAEPISFPYKEAEFRLSGPPNGTLDGWAFKRFNIPGFSVQYAGSKEGEPCLSDDVTEDLLNKWSLRHSYALTAVMEYTYSNPFKG